MPNLKNSYAIFWVIFNHCADGQRQMSGNLDFSCFLGSTRVARVQQNGVFLPFSICWMVCQEKGSRGNLAWYVTLLGIEKSGLRLKSQLWPLGLPKNFYRFMTYLWPEISFRDDLANFMVCILTIWKFSSLKSLELQLFKKNENHFSTL